MSEPTDQPEGVPSAGPRGVLSASSVGVALALLLLNLLVAAVGGWFTASSVGTWYQTLNKPALNPPDWVFGPVWTVLYVMMALAAWCVWRRAGSWRRAMGAGVAYLLQLALNLLWSVVFFGWRSPAGALVVIVLLWLAIAWTLWRFAQHTRLAAALLAPYLAWVSFAGLLNLLIVRLN